MRFNWATQGWEPVEVHEEELADALHQSTHGDSDNPVRQLVSLEEYEVIQQMENHFKMGSGPALVSLMDRLPDKLDATDELDDTLN